MSSHHEQNQKRRHYGAYGRARERGLRRGGSDGDRNVDGRSSLPISDIKGGKILILHGDRQTGTLLLGRLRPLLKRLHGNFGTCAEAPDGPFEWEPLPGVHVPPPQSSIVDVEEEEERRLLRTWWRREENVYLGLEHALSAVRGVWDSNSDGSFDGILGFSRGARLAHLIAVLHENSGGVAFGGLKYLIFAGGYGDIPLPDNLLEAASVAGIPCADNASSCNINIPSLHMMGRKDKLIPLEKSRALLREYINPTEYEHDGGHFVPVKRADVDVTTDFVRKVLRLRQNDVVEEKATSNMISAAPVSVPQPDEEHATIQADEASSLRAIFPDEFRLLSEYKGNFDDDDEEFTCHEKYHHPIAYSIQLNPTSKEIENDNVLWPPRDIFLCINYPANYPDAGSPPNFSIKHDGLNVFEFCPETERACLEAATNAALEFEGTPCVMAAVFSVRDFFEGGGIQHHNETSTKIEEEGEELDRSPVDKMEGETVTMLSEKGVIAEVSATKLEECTLQGSKIATQILSRGCRTRTSAVSMVGPQDSSEIPASHNSAGSGGGGVWNYTIGLVGKPSAGKSTFFNAATAFARQRGRNHAVPMTKDGADIHSTDQLQIGGASMASHPFTTIDPNVGYCLVPAPPGSCPEDDLNDEEWEKIAGVRLGSTHGRLKGRRRLLPVFLKDVAGLVPGAYQGRGRGNKFLDDLTDADVLIHVLDASGTADTEGNAVGYIVEEDDKHLHKQGAGSTPLDDLAWVQNELIQWVYSNLIAKWDSIRRRGRNKLVSMFSGYKQSQPFVWDILLSVESYLSKYENRDHALDRLVTWDAGDLHRLVVAFLGVRFPMALALNKSDLLSASENIKDVQEALPVHGAHVGVPMSAKEEMNYVWHHVKGSLHHEARKEVKEPTCVDKDHYAQDCDPPTNDAISSSSACGSSSLPDKMWECLSSALRLREPILVFPVSDMMTYEPLPGMDEAITKSVSLPNAGMIACLEAAGGEAPTLWDPMKRRYVTGSPNVSSDGRRAGEIHSKKEEARVTSLRDVLVLKPGSRVEDVFTVLKWMKVLGGEFVRAEGAGKIGDKPKLVKKDDLIGRHNRILKIMTTKRRNWQNKISVAG